MPPLYHLARFVASLTPEERARYQQWLDRHAADGWGLRSDADRTGLDAVARSLGVAAKRSRPVTRRG